MKLWEFLYKHRLIVLALLIGVLIAAFFPYVSHLTPEDIVETAPESMLTVFFVLLGLYGLKSVVMVIPIIALYLAAGMVYPTGWAILLTYCFLTVEVTLGYLLGRLMGEDKVGALLKKYKGTRKIHVLYTGNSVTASFLLRIIPLPVDLISLLLGTSGVSYIKYLFLSLLGLTPGMIPYVVAGGAIADPLSPRFLVPLGVCLLLAAGSFVFFRGMTRKRERKEKGRRPK